MKSNNDKTYESLNGSKSLLVTFGGIQQGVGVPMFEFFKSLDTLNCDKVFIRDFNQAWYHIGEKSLNGIIETQDYLNSLITANAYTNVCFLGNSMGGYAAILFGILLNIDSVISFSPQTFINKSTRFIYFDKRWSKKIKNLHDRNLTTKKYFDLKKFVKGQNYNTIVEIHYSQKDKLDLIHAKRMRYLNGFDIINYIDGGHSLVKKLRDDQILLRLISDKINK